MTTGRGVRLVRPGGSVDRGGGDDGELIAVGKSIMFEIVTGLVGTGAGRENMYGCAAAVGW